VPKGGPPTERFGPGPEILGFWPTRAGTSGEVDPPVGLFDPESAAHDARKALVSLVQRERIGPKMVLYLG
jgi:hypothetical protein